MSFIILATIFVIAYVRGCSILLPQNGTLYISNIQLLSYDTNSALITIIEGGSNDIWCKVMDLSTGEVGYAVDCTEYEDDIKDYSSATTDTTSTTLTSFEDNCDGATATISLMRNNEEINITDVPYADSDTICSDTNGAIWNIATGLYFTVNAYGGEDITTTFIFTSTADMVAIEFAGYDDNSYTLYTVTKETIGTDNYYDSAFASVYEDVNVVALPLPCCLCYSYSLTQYTLSPPINSNTDSYTVTFESVLFGGGSVDADNERILSIGLGYGSTVYIYDLSDSGNDAEFSPDLTYQVEPSTTPIDELSSTFSTELETQTTESMTETMDCVCVTTPCDCGGGSDTSTSMTPLGSDATRFTLFVGLILGFIVWITMGF